jgi:hypothetical protein
MATCNLKAYLQRCTTNQFRMVPTLPWSVLGPQHTTWFEQKSRNWQNSLYGFRTAGIYGSSSDWSRMPSRLLIRDFNPHVHLGCNARDTAGWHSRLIRGELTTAIRPPFMEPLGSALSYREIVSNELFNAEGILMDESRIILQKVSRKLAATYILGPSTHNEIL